VGRLEVANDFYALTPRMLFTSFDETSISVAVPWGTSEDFFHWSSHSGRGETVVDIQRIAAGWLEAAGASLCGH
jgi:hypothetical protein